MSIKKYIQNFITLINPHMKPIAIYLLFLSTLISFNTYSQNCPEITAGVQHCSNNYDHARENHENDYNHTIAGCDIDFESDVNEATAEWEADGELDPAELEEDILELVDELLLCDEEAMDVWADSIMDDADGWNTCLCNNGCDYYCGM